MTLISVDTNVPCIYFLSFLLMWIICKVFIKLVTKLLLLLLFYYFGSGGTWYLAHWPGIQPTPPLEGEILTIGPPGKSQKDTF